MVKSGTLISLQKELGPKQKAENEKLVDQKRLWKWSLSLKIAFVVVFILPVTSSSLELLLKSTATTYDR